MKTKTLLPEARMRYLILLFVTIMICSPVCAAHAGAIKEETFQRLDNIREEKKKQLLEYLERISKNADSITSDELMLEFFHIKGKYYRLKKSSPPPAELKRLIDDLKNGVRRHYIRNYLSFYDILGKEINL